jgi:hypothetical protein
MGGRYRRGYNEKSRGTSTSAEVRPSIPSHSSQMLIFLLCRCSSDRRHPQEVRTLCKRNSLLTFLYSAAGKILRRELRELAKKDLHVTGAVKAKL